MVDTEFQRIMGTIVLDFDGVLHRYSKGWQNGVIYDEPVPEAQAACEALQQAGFHLVVSTAREDLEPVRDWLEKWGFPHMEVTNQKPIGVLYIDDRGYRFDGNWNNTLMALPGLVAITRMKEPARD